MRTSRAAHASRRRQPLSSFPSKGVRRVHAIPSAKHPTQSPMTSAHLLQIRTVAQNPDDLETQAAGSCSRQGRFA